MVNISTSTVVNFSIVIYKHADCESIQETVDVRDKGADTPVGQVLLVPKKSDK